MVRLGRKGVRDGRGCVWGRRGHGAQGQARAIKGVRLCQLWFRSHRVKLLDYEFKVTLWVKYRGPRVTILMNIPGAPLIFMCPSVALGVIVNNTVYIAWYSNDIGYSVVVG